MTIVDGRGMFGGRSLAEQMTVWNLAAVKEGLMVMPAPPPATELSDAPALLARLEHGRWLVDCECKSAEAVWYDAPMMFCRNCRNPSAGGRWRRVTIPANRNEIMALLRYRNTENQHWWPQDTLEDLRRDNELHGIGVMA